MSVLPQWDEKRSRALRSMVPVLPLLFLASAGDDTARTPKLLLIGIDPRSTLARRWTGDPGGNEKRPDEG